MEELPILYEVCFLGLILGIGFGFVAQKTHFCTMGAISDIYFFGDWNRFRAWVFAMVVALSGSQTLYLLGIIDLSNSIYLSPNFGWFGHVVGGCMFGFGMTLGGGCGNKTLVRIGGGNLKSLVVAIFMGLFAYMTLRGIVGLGRVELESVTSIDLTFWDIERQGIPDFLMLSGLEKNMARILPLFLLAGGGLVFCLKCSKFRNSMTDVTAGLLIGVFVTLAWYVTGVIGNDEFEPIPLASFSFVAPVGESIQYLMTFTGATINFGIAVVGGIILGAFLSANLSGEFRVECFSSASDMTNHIFGGILMGIGGVLALGCTIGQGVTGISTLAFGSFIALLSILGGGFFGMRYLEEGTIKKAVYSFF